MKVLTKKVQGTMTLTSSDRSDAYEAAGPFQKVNIYCNSSKILDTHNSLCNQPKIRVKKCYETVMLKRDADKIANSEDPIQK